MANLEHADLPLVLCSKPGFICDEKEPQKLLGYLETHGFDPEVIIIETFTRVMEGDENTARDTRQFWKNLEQLRQNGRTIILSHHMSKPSEGGNRSIRHRARGSTDIMAGVDSAFAIQKKRERLIQVEHVKSRAAEEVGSFIVRFECEGQDGPAQFSLETVPQTSGLLQHSEPNGFALIDEFLKGRNTDIVRSREIIQRLVEKDIRKRSAERILQAYVREGHLEKVNHVIHAWDRVGQMIKAAEENKWSPNRSVLTS